MTPDTPDARDRTPQWPTTHIFVSYSHHDQRWVEEDGTDLIPFLARSLRAHDVVFWYDRELRRFPGEDYREHTKEEIERADFVILLLNQELVSSEFIRDYELPLIRRRYDQGALRIVPILVGDVVWSTADHFDWITKLQILPGATPLIRSVADPAEWHRVRAGILASIDAQITRLRTNAPRLTPGKPSPPSPPPEPVVEHSPRGGEALPGDAPSAPIRDAEIVRRGVPPAPPSVRRGRVTAVSLIAAAVLMAVVAYLAW